MKIILVGGNYMEPKLNQNNFLLIKMEWFWLLAVHCNGEVLLELWKRDNPRKGGETNAKSRR